MRATLAFDQPQLTAAYDGRKIVIRGIYLLFEPDAITNPAGPIAEYELKIILPSTYPQQEPKVFEVGGRIPWIRDRHVNSDGDCCITVWENWLVCASDHSFSAFMNGPLAKYFFGQHHYEQIGTWPLGERPHGDRGYIEACADALGLSIEKVDEQTILYCLKLLSQSWPKGHWKCPCGSGEILRRCHREDLWVLHEKIPPKIASHMLQRLGKKKSGFVVSPASVIGSSMFTQ